jgi:hypothetical protein
MPGESSGSNWNRRRGMRRAFKSAAIVRVEAPSANRPKIS